MCPSLFLKNQYKSCLEAYENAIQCPISGSCGKIWRAYANYCRVRNRLRSAQKVYLSALVGDGPSGKGKVTDETERFKLWNDFLSLARDTNNDPTLSIDRLMTAVREEHNSSKRGAESENPNNPNVQNTSERPPKMQKINHAENSAIPSLPLPTNTNGLNSIMNNNQIPKTHDMTTHPLPTIPIHPQSKANITEQIHLETKQLLSLTQGNMPPELMAIWMAIDGDTPPSRPEPPLFASSPPKLSDVSGKDILGSDMALKLLRILTHPLEGNIMLDVCRGCWVMTALTEQEVVNAIKRFEQQMVCFLFLRYTDNFLKHYFYPLISS